MGWDGLERRVGRLEKEQGIGAPRVIIAVDCYPEFQERLAEAERLRAAGVEVQVLTIRSGYGPPDGEAAP